ARRADAPRGGRRHGSGDGGARDRLVGGPHGVRRRGHGRQAGRNHRPRAERSGAAGAEGARSRVPPSDLRTRVHGARQHRASAFPLARPEAVARDPGVRAGRRGVGTLRASGAAPPRARMRLGGPRVGERAGRPTAVGFATVDLLLRNATVYTVDDAMPWAQAVAIAGDRIAWVGRDAEAPEAKETMDLGGRLLLPGFVDAHNHVRLGSDEEAVTLRDAETLDEVRGALDAYAAAHPENDWIVGEEWGYAAGPEGRPPRADDLDGIAGGRPILVFSYDVHNVWVNSEAMRRFGLSGESPEVPFGHSEIAPDGTPTGYLHDFAVMGLSRAGHAMLTEHVRPNFTPESQYRRLLSSLDMAIGFGITTVVEPQNSVDDLPHFQR